MFDLRNYFSALIFLKHWLLLGYESSLFVTPSELDFKLYILFSLSCNACAYLFMSFRVSMLHEPLFKVIFFVYIF